MTPNEPLTAPPVEDQVLETAVLIARGERTPGPPMTVAGDSDALPGPRARELLEQVLVGAKADEALEWLQRAGVLGRLLPEVQATVGFAQEMGRRHKDVWKHTKQVVVQSTPDPAIRWAALLHDVGKVPTRALTPEGKVTFHGHAEVGARLFDRISRRMGFPKPLHAQVRFLILHHLRANQYDGSWTDSAVRRFDRELGEHLDALLRLSRADITSARREKREAGLAQIDELQSRIAALREIDSRRPPLPSGLGDHIMACFGLPPGRQIGELRRELEQAVATGELEPHREPDYYLEHLRRRGLSRSPGE